MIMATRKRKTKFCTDDAGSGCSPGALTGKRKNATNSRKINKVLDDQGVIVDRDEQDRFVEFIERSVRQREVVLQLWARLDQNDIISLIVAARDADDLDEAIWRCFLAAHFGRPSARPKTENQVESASMLLCGFGATPKWTWNKVQKNWKSLRVWLYNHDYDLQALSFGNHRKYESQQPDLLWEVIESFIDLADECGGPMAMFTLEGDEDDQFHTLYRRLSKLHRFGRTGRFDFLVMLLDLGMITAEPKSCYLRGATGPKQGAMRLWGNRGIGELEQLAAELSEQCGVSPVVVEDALCNWQK